MVLFKLSLSYLNVFLHFLFILFTCHSLHSLGSSRPSRCSSALPLSPLPAHISHHRPPFFHPQLCNFTMSVLFRDELPVVFVHPSIHLFIQLKRLIISSHHRLTLTSGFILSSSLISSTSIYLVRDSEGAKLPDLERTSSCHLFFSANTTGGVQ